MKFSYLPKVIGTSAIAASLTVLSSSAYARPRYDEQYMAQYQTEPSESVLEVNEAQQNVNEAQENVNEAQENTRDAQLNTLDAQENTRDAQENVRDAQRNLQETGTKAKDVIESTGTAAKQNLEAAGEATRRSAEDATQKIQEASEEAQRNIQRTSEEARQEMAETADEQEEQKWAILTLFAVLGLLGVGLVALLAGKKSRSSKKTEYYSDRSESNGHDPSLPKQKRTKVVTTSTRLEK